MVFFNLGPTVKLCKSTSYYYKEANIFLVDNTNATRGIKKETNELVQLSVDQSLLWSE